MTAREFARKLVAQQLERQPHIDPDEWFHLSGGAGPAHDDAPRYNWNGSGFPYRRPDSSLNLVPRGKLHVEIGGTWEQPADVGLFSIRELLVEVRSGHAQSSLF